MRAYVPGFALFTLACGSAAGIANNATAADQSGAGGGDAWAGRYEGRTDGGDGILDIRAGRGSSYDVSMEIAAPGCGGDVHGQGTVTNGRLIVTSTAPDGGQCVLEFTRNGSRLRSTEAGSCYAMHGPSCDFTGTLTRTGAAQSAAGGASNEASRGKVENPAEAYAELVRSTDNGGPVGTMDGNRGSSGAAWIVGSWTTDRSDCDTVADLNLRADGTYFADGESGRWTLSGNTLSITVLMRNVEGGEFGDERPVRNPRPSLSEVRQLSRNRIWLNGADGRIVTLERC